MATINPAWHSSMTTPTMTDAQYLRRRAAAEKALAKGNCGSPSIKAVHAYLKNAIGPEVGGWASNMAKGIRRNNFQDFDNKVRALCQLNLGGLRRRRRSSSRRR